MGTAIVVAFCGLIAWFVWYHSKQQTLKRKLRDAKAWPIAELPEDTLGKIVGRARPLESTLTAPISGRPCLVYEVSVVQDHGKSTSTIIHEVNGVPFVVIDDTGHAIVDPHQSEVVLETDHTTSSGSFDDATQIEEAFLQRHGRESKGWMFNKSLSYREAIVGIEEPVAVLGSGVREPDPDAAPAATYRGAPPTRLRISGSRDYKLVISDDVETLSRRS